MRITIVCVGRARPPFADAIEEYERRVGRYFSFETITVREASAQARRPVQVVDAEGEQLLARLPRQHEVVALNRVGTEWSSEQLAQHLSAGGSRSAAGISFVIGGAFGLSSAVLNRADRAFSLSPMTLPHELARLVLTEQLYRAGTILRGEPYHKGPLA